MAFCTTCCLLPPHTHTDHAHTEALAHWKTGTQQERTEATQVPSISYRGLETHSTSSTGRERYTTQLAPFLSWPFFLRSTETSGTRRWHRCARVMRYRAKLLTTNSRAQGCSGLPSEMSAQDMAVAQSNRSQPHGTKGRLCKQTHRWCWSLRARWAAGLSCVEKDIKLDIYLYEVPCDFQPLEEKKNSIPCLWWYMIIVKESCKWPPKTIIKIFLP